MFWRSRSRIDKLNARVAIDTVRLIYIMRLINSTCVRSTPSRTPSRRDGALVKISIYIFLLYEKAPVLAESPFLLLARIRRSQFLNFGTSGFLPPFLIKQVVFSNRGIRTLNTFIRSQTRRLTNGFIFVRIIASLRITLKGHSYIKDLSIFILRMNPSLNLGSSQNGKWINQRMISLFIRVMGSFCLESSTAYHFNKQALGFYSGEMPNAEALLCGILFKMIELRGSIQDENDYMLLFYNSDDLFYPHEGDDSINWMRQIDIQFRYSTFPDSYPNDDIFSNPLNPSDFNERILQGIEEIDY